MAKLLEGIAKIEKAPFVFISDKDRENVTLTKSKIFRFDDICLNSNIQQAATMSKALKSHFPNCVIMWVISLLSTPEDNLSQRVFPSIWKAYSDYKVFFQVKQMGIPNVPGNMGIQIASHGLVHVDHRLLTKEAQEMSILVSCSLLHTDKYVPPFNKWNSDTEAICDEANINLIKFEDGWLNMKFETDKPRHQKWYLHHREFTMDELFQWIGRNK